MRMADVKPQAWGARPCPIPTRGTACPCFNPWPLRSSGNLFHQEKAT
jgi:hypothetical protein